MGHICASVNLFMARSVQTYRTSMGLPLATLRTIILRKGCNWKRRQTWTTIVRPWRGW